MFDTVKKWFGAMGGTADKYQQAVTFAEANAPEMAGEERAEAAIEEGPSKLLVVGNESAFSEDVVAYSLDMAGRMAYEIVALNAAPLSCQTFRLFSDSRKQVCEDFKGLSEQSAEAFRQRAAEAGIPFSHVVKFDEVETAVSEVMKAESTIDFVISDTAEPAENRVREENRPRNEIFVYSMNVH